MEKIEARSSSSRAKLLGTMITISGAMVFTFYKGPEIFQMLPSHDSPNDKLLLSQPSHWILGGLLILIAAICASIWNVLHISTAREYPDQFTIVFFFCLFGTIQCIALSFFLERNPSAWVLHPGIEMIAVVFGAIYFVFRYNVVTWCLEKKGPVFVVTFSPLSIVIASIMGIAFLGDSIYLGSGIGAPIIAAGSYIVMWGKAKENNTLAFVIDRDLVVADKPESSNQNTPLLSSGKESTC